MKRYLTLCFVVLLALVQTGPLQADNSNIAAQATTSQQEMPALQACPMPTGQRIDTAQVSQTDCCKGHKGVCGCRAGKIVCCDNTVSPTCTCHSDWDMAN
jgi:hypothetical protein